MPYGRPKRIKKANRGQRVQKPVTWKPYDATKTVGNKQIHYWQFMVPTGKYITQKMAQKGIDVLKKSRAFKNKKIDGYPVLLISNGATWSPFYSMKDRDDYFDELGAIEMAKYIRGLKIVITTIS